MKNDGHYQHVSNLDNETVQLLICSFITSNFVLRTKINRFHTPASCHHLFLQLHLSLPYQLATLHPPSTPCSTKFNHARFMRLTPCVRPEMQLAFN